MNKKEKKEKIIQRLKNRYRFIIYNDATFQTVWSARLTRMNVLIMGLFGGLLLVFITVLIVAYTPARQLIPGYPSEDVRNMMVRNAILADSLEQQIRLRDHFFHSIRSVIQGEIPEAPEYDLDTIVSPVEIEFPEYNHDSLFYQNLLEERLDLSLQRDNTQQKNIARIHFFTPLQGMVSQGFDKTIDHFAVDIVGLPGSRISSVLDGTVIFSGWTVEAGYVIYVQHDDGLVSVYKHNSELLKKTGDHVNAGEVIALMGNTGELTTGPHLHFELWHHGTPLDPEQYIDF
ncbi:MAG: M23 family metallopeptidase [Mangrovibacterium sp.]